MTASERSIYVDAIDFERPEAQLADSTDHVVLALGERYPRSVELDLTGVWKARCAGPGGTLRIDAITGGGAGLALEQPGPARLSVRTDGTEGEETFHVTGTFLADGPFLGGCWDGMEDHSRLDFELTLIVQSREIGGVALRSRACADAPPAFFASTSLEGLQYDALDNDGERIAPANAEREHPVDLAISTRDASRLFLDGPAVIDNVWLPDAATTVEVRAPVGEAALVDVVEPAGVHELESQFVLVGFSGPTPLADGATIDGVAMEHAGNRIYLKLGGAQQVDGRTMCSSVPPELFVLESLTPATCRVLDRSEDREWPSYFGELVHGGELVADGRCSLRWRAPTLVDGAGLEGGIDVQLRNVDALDDPGGG